MDNTTMLAMLKADLGFKDPPQEVAAYLAQLLETAEAQIRGRGAPLADVTADQLFTASWAAWLYRKRVNGEGLPDMLRQELHSRLVRKVTTEEAGA